MSTLDEFTRSLRQQMAQGDMELALDRLQGYLRANAPTLVDDGVLLMSRYHRLRREERRGTLARADFEAELNRLTQHALALLDDVARQATPLPPSTPAPVAQEVRLPAEVGLEKIMGVNNLKQIAWLEQGIRAATGVCRIHASTGKGTGVLIAPHVLMTNNHVLPRADIAGQAVAEFGYQLQFNQEPAPSYRYPLDGSRFYTNVELDYTLVGLLPDPNKPPLDQVAQPVRLNPYAEPVAGEHVIIIQHPNGGPKQIVLTANQVVSSWEYRLHYTTDTMPGSSGAPVFNDMWEVIALHHAGGHLQVNERNERRFVNEGILLGAIRANAGSWWPGG